jgi:outer membrane protein
MRAHVASLLLVLLPAVCTQAAKPWTLEACIQRAIEQNVSIRSAVITRQNQELQYQNAKNQRLLGVYGQVSQNISYGQYPNSLGYYSYGNSQRMQVPYASMTLFSGFQLKLPSNPTH